MDIENIGVVGCGLMGSGIVEVCARAGYQVIVAEVSTEFLDRGLGRIRRSMGKAVARGKATQEQADDALSRIRGTLMLDELSDCGLVVEAAIENMAIKKEIFAKLDGVLPSHAILASNTSSLCCPAEEQGSYIKNLCAPFSCCFQPWICNQKEVI